MHDHRSLTVYLLLDTEKMLSLKHYMAIQKYAG